MTETMSDATDRLQKWLLGITASLLLVGIGAFFHLGDKVGDLNTDLNVRMSVLETKMTLMLSRERRIDALEKWQRDWPQTGRLQEDVRQNARLDQMAKQIEELRTKGPR